MKKFWVLLKLSFKSILLTSMGTGQGNRKWAASGIGAVAVLAFAGIYISGFYSMMMLEALSPLGMEVLVFIFMGMFALVGGLLVTIFAAKGIVFEGKDNDLLLSLPVPTHTLMASRMAAIYFQNLLFTFFVLVPAGVACAFTSTSGLGTTVSFWVCLVLAVVALPLLETALVVLLAALLAFVSAKVSKGRALGQNIALGIYFVLFIWFSFTLSGQIENLAANALGIKNSLTWAAPLVWMGDGIVGNWGLLAAFIACCVAPFALVTAGLGRVYRKAVTTFQARSARSDYRLTVQTAAGVKRTLLRKEAQRFFGTPMYLWNTGLGLLFLLVLGVGALVARQSVLNVLAMVDQNMVLPIAAVTICTCICLCPITAPSFSLEGKCMWILKEAPITEKTVLGIKTGFHLLLMVPFVLLAGVCIAIATSLSVGEGALLLAVTVVFAVAQTSFGTLIGLMFPKMDAANDTVVVKQSMAVFLGTFGPLAVVAVAAVLWWVTDRISGAAGLGMFAGFIALVAAVCAALLWVRGPALVRAL